MKLILPIILGLVCIGLVAWLIATKKAGDAQYASDVAAFTDVSNRLSSAQDTITLRESTLLTFSNSLNDSQSALLDFSNQLAGAQATITLNGQQITNLTLQLAQAQSKNEALARHALNLTNQMDDLADQLASTHASLVRTNKDLVQLYEDYGALSHRFQIDVAERLVAERKFNNPGELKLQLQKLKKNPAAVVSAESIYAGLEVEIRSNGWAHVVATN
jgi:chromosome segregation ATPase